LIIRSLTTYRVAPRWLFLKIETDDGLCGWGEAVLEGHTSAAEAAVSEMGRLLIGTDPRRINDIWQLLYRHGCYRGGPILMSAMSGIDIALWDILGKSLGVPVHSLLGGAQRDRVRTYSWIGGDTPSGLVTGARRAAELGFTAVKFNATGSMSMIDTSKSIDEAVCRVAELRNAVGFEMDLAIDFHGRVHLPMAKQLLRELEPFRPMWVEDPVPADNTAAVIELARSTSIPIAVGERVHSRSEFLALITSGVVRVINPDPVHAGGISETVRLGALAEMFGIALAPHCPLGPIALAACLQIDAVCYSAVIQEQSEGIHYNGRQEVSSYLKGQPFAFEEGFLRIPQGPGIGVEIDEDYVEEQAERGHDWSAPVWRHADGSVAEW